MNGVWARYGNVLLKMAPCVACKTESFVIDGEMACCGISAAVMANKERLMVAPRFRRARPSGPRQREILAFQESRCLYCQNEFGTFVEIRGKAQRLGVAWDHFVPYSYSGNSRDENFAAACGPCNGLKNNRIFESVEDARAFVRRGWFRKGFRVL